MAHPGCVAEHHDVRGQYVRLGAACDALGSVDWPALSRKLSALDIESANDTLASLQKAADALAQLTGRLNTLFGARG